MNFNSGFPIYKQYDKRDCGPTCLRMIARYYGKLYSLAYLREQSYVTRDGASLLGLRDAAAAIGLEAKCVQVSLAYLEKEAVLPCIAHWDHNHFVVIYKIKNNRIYVADPAYGKIKYRQGTFLAHWAKSDVAEGYALLVRPTMEFDQKQEIPAPGTNFRLLLLYLKPYRQLLAQLLLGMLLGSLIQLALPFLAQQIVDRGVSYKNIGILQLVLLGQFLLILSRVAVNFIRSWILFYISTPINVTLVYDFLVKLIKLPLEFFDTKMVGDILQRIGDHQRVEYFLTSTVLSIGLTIVNIIVFSMVLFIYNLNIFLIFLVGTVLYLFWMGLFLKKRGELDFVRFKQMSANQNILLQLIMGMPEIKLNNCANKKIRDWAKIQEVLFASGTKSVALTQKQQSGCALIQETKNILITFFAAYLVIQGNLTLGMMLAIQFILGQLNGPIEQLAHLVTAAQDAKLSFERIDEIHRKRDEEDSEAIKTNIIPSDADIVVTNLSFQYGDPYSEKVLKNISLVLPDKKVTAIVGTSGSGKTTLLKLLLGFYQPAEGMIKVGDIPLNEIRLGFWRDQCGLVMQDGYIFSDTLANNIALKDEAIDGERMSQAAQIANIDQFIATLPLGYRTKIGTDGHGLSQGQKQRILIARAVYKNPKYLFFDEATNSLDTENESIIMKNLEHFFQGRTVVIVAHRLSTVRNADQIVVLDQGVIAETGVHNQLIMKKGVYYNLVKNQLELEN